jgi:hypothetical protein
VGGMTFLLVCLIAAHVRQLPEKWRAENFQKSYEDAEFGPWGMSSNSSHYFQLRRFSQWNSLLDLYFFQDFHSKDHTFIRDFTSFSVS